VRKGSEGSATGDNCGRMSVLGDHSTLSADGVSDGGACGGLCLPTSTTAYEKPIWHLLETGHGVA